MHVCLLSLCVILAFGLHPGLDEGSGGKGCKAKVGKWGRAWHPLGHTAVTGLETSGSPGEAPRKHTCFFPKRQQNSLRRAPACFLNTMLSSLSLP